MDRPTFHFPALFLIPGFDEQVIEVGDYGVVRRRWQISVFDLATLFTKHKLHLNYQAIGLFLDQCNLEIGISGVTTLADACQKPNHLRLALYSEHVSPFLTPFATNYSINEYSGINSRDSEYGAKQLTEELRKGLTSETGTLEAWPVELSFQVMTIPKGFTLTKQMFETAAEKAHRWAGIFRSQPAARTFGQAILSAPLVPIRSQSVLHLWCAIESLFPNVSTESTFRYALYLAQMSAERTDRRKYFDQIKKAYNVRSKIAHGAKQEASSEEWNEVWGYILDAFGAVLKHGGIPSEDTILDGILAVDSTDGHRGPLAKGQ